MKSFFTWPKRSPRFSMSIRLSASATLPKCITSTSRVSKTTVLSILASTTWKDKSWSRLESVKKHLHASRNVVPMWPRLLGSLHQLPVERDSNIFPDDISVTTCAGCKGEEVEEVLGGKASRLQQLLQRQRSRQKSPTHSGEERYFWRVLSILTWSSSARIFWILLTSPATLCWVKSPARNAERWMFQIPPGTL